MVWQTQSEIQAARAVNIPGPGSLGAQAWQAWQTGVPSNNKTFLEAFLSVAEAQQIFDSVTEGIGLLESARDIQAIVTYASFPTTYLDSDIACMLADTGRLTDPGAVALRIGETAKKLDKILLELGPGGRGLIRAMWLGRSHAQRVLTADGANAMNQVSMAFTLLTFSWVVLQSPQLPTVPAGADEAWLKLWNVIGGLMGIVEDGLPATRDAAAALFQLILESAQGAPLSNAGQRLVAAFTQGLGPSSVANIQKYAGDDLARKLELIL